METPEEVVDLRGLKCPLPALMARRHLTRAPAHAVVAVLTDDPMASIDVSHMCASEGFEVLEVRRMGDQWRIILQKPY